MRSYLELKRILELWAQGTTKQGISTQLGIPRATVRDCIDRYGSVEKLDAIINGHPLSSEDLSSETEGRNYIIPGYSPRKQSYTDEALIKAVAESVSLADVIRRLGLCPAGGNYELAKMRIRKLGLNTSHFTGQAWNKGKKSSIKIERALEEILVQGSTYVSTTHLRKRLIAEGIFQHQCASCGLSEWLERPIPLEIDHVNGDRRDNRLENLRLLCPNCHALTTTYRGKNKRANSD